MTQNECPEKKDLNLFLSDQLSGARREEVEFHLSRCSVCRQKLIQLFESAQPESTALPVPGRLKARVLRIPDQSGFPVRSFLFDFRRRIAVVLATGALAAIGLAAYLLLSESLGVRPVPQTDVFRNENASLANPILLAPKKDTNLSGTVIEFKWSKVAEAESYVFTLLDEKGNILSQTSTKETRLTLQTFGVPIQANKQYFWFIRANSSRGTQTDSQIASFRYNGK